MRDSHVGFTHWTIERCMSSRARVRSQTATSKKSLFMWSTQQKKKKIKMYLLLHIYTPHSQSKLVSNHGIVDVVVVVACPEKSTKINEGSVDDDGVWLAVVHLFTRQLAREHWSFTFQHLIWFFVLLCRLRFMTLIRRVVIRRRWTAISIRHRPNPMICNYWIGESSVFSVITCICIAYKLCEG